MYTVSPEAAIGKNVIIRDGAVIEANAIIGDGCLIDYHAVVRENVIIESDTYIGAHCVIGEYLMDFYPSRVNKPHPVSIGAGGLIRSHCVVYGGCEIGNDFQCGHHVVIRENARIGQHTSVGTFGDIQGNCMIGDYVHIHSNVFVAPHTMIGNYCWIFGGVIITNDPTPPSDVVMGVEIDDFAVVSAGSVLLPGVHVGKDALVGAGCVLTKDVPRERIFFGNPGRDMGPVSAILNRKNGMSAYPWRYAFTRGTPWSGSDFDTWYRQNVDRLKDDASGVKGIDP